MKGKGSWLMILGLIIIAAILGIIFRGSVEITDDPNLNKRDSPWILTATALVLLVTPGLGFLYRGMIHPRNIISIIFQSFISIRFMGNYWITATENSEKIGSYINLHNESYGFDSNEE